MRIWPSQPEFVRYRVTGPVAVLAVLLAAVLVLSGCGDASFSPSTPTGSPSQNPAGVSDSHETGEMGRPQGGGSPVLSASPGPGRDGGGEGHGGVEQKGGESAETVRLRGVLAMLEVKGRAPKNDYQRAAFGQRWKDVDRNGCDQRNDVLARDLQNVEAPKGCKVVRGVLHDPYTGQVIQFQRGERTSSAVQIDHVVALADAWQKGAQQWAPEQREKFANDLQNLLAVDGPSNMQKGAGDAATWLPANKVFRCRYVSIQIEVKAKYGLWVTPAERDAMARELGRCG